MNFFRWLEIVVDGCRWLLVCFTNYAFLFNGTSRLPRDEPALVKSKFQSRISYVLRHITCTGEWFQQATITNIYTSQRELKGTMQDTYRS